MRDDTVLNIALQAEARCPNLREFMTLRSAGKSAMKIAVIGAGIIGVTTAFELAADGHEVTVFERRGSVAEETSFANAGVVAPGYVTPWAAPGMPGKVRASCSARTRRCGVTLAAVAATTSRWMWQW